MKRILLLVFVCVGAIFSDWNQGQRAKCTDRMEHIPNLTNAVGSSAALQCPKNCTSGTIYGDGVYTTDSPICVAAVHAGVIKASKGGPVTIKVVASQPSYQ